MAFCKYCGKELKDGEVCNCRTTAAGSSEPAATGAAQPAAGATAQTTAAQLAAAAAQTTAAQPAAAAAQTTAAQPTAGAATQAAGAATQAAGAATGAATTAGAAAAPKVDTEKITSTAKKVGGMYLKIWAKPATVGKEMMASVDMIQGLCMVVVQALLSSIFSLCIAGKINAAFADAFSSYTSLLGSDYAKQFKVSGAKVFFLTLLLSLLFSVIWGLAFGLIGLISKAKMGLGQILALMAARSVIVAPLTVLACIVFWISPAVGLVIFFGSILMVICTTAEMLKAVQGVSADKCVYLTFIGVLLFIIVFVLIGSKAIGAYIPEGIISSLDSISGLF